MSYHTLAVTYSKLLETKASPQGIFSEHSYCSFKVLKEQDSSDKALQIAPLHATLAEEGEVSDELNFSPPAYQEI